MTRFGIFCSIWLKTKYLITNPTFEMRWPVTQDCFRSKVYLIRQYNMYLKSRCNTILRKLSGRKEHSWVKAMSPLVSAWWMFLYQAFTNLTYIYKFIVEKLESQLLFLCNVCFYSSQKFDFLIGLLPDKICFSVMFVSILHKNLIFQ
jgi:hypothetical protein